jgi:hypothetical protein
MFRSLMKSSTMRMAPFSRAFSVVPPVATAAEAGQQAGLTSCRCSTDPSWMLRTGAERYLQQLDKNTAQIEDLAKIVKQIQLTRDSDMEYIIRQEKVRENDGWVLAGAVWVVAIAMSGLGIASVISR